MAILRCDECGRLIDAAPGEFYCPSGECRARNHARLLGKTLETRNQPTPPARRQTISVSRAWTALAAEAAGFS